MRFRARHAQQTIADYIETTLNGLGWSAPAWGTPAITYKEVTPDDVEAIVPNTVATLIEEIGPDLEEELGAGLQSVDYELVVDVYGEKLSVALSIAEDIKDALTHKIIALKDYSTNPAVETTAQIEFDRVEIARPSGIASGIDLRKNWRSVLATARCYFVE